MRLLIALTVVPLLAACSLDADSDAGSAKASVAGIEMAASDGRAAIKVGGESGFKIDTDDFKAALEFPGMEFGGKNFDIEGMKLYPGSKVGGMNVNARDKGDEKRGTVKVSFVSPANPDAVLAHAEKEAVREGFTVSRSSLGLTGSNGKDKSIAYLVAAEGSGTRGTLTLTDKHSKEW